MSERTEVEAVDAVAQAMREPARIVVCDKCLKASCWHGLFYCDDYQTAGLVRATEAQLRQLNREHPSYFMPHFAEGDDDALEPALTDARVEQELREPAPPNDASAG